MKRTILSYLFMVSLVVACDRGGQAPVDGGSDAPGDASGDAGDVCDSASEGAACSVEGASCGGPCTDACSFCNILSCDAGIWTRYEVFPAPCFECGVELRCRSETQYCTIQRSDVVGEPDVFECRPMPESCSADPTCACLEQEVAPDQCTGESGELTVESVGG